MDLPREERLRWTLEKSAQLLHGGAEPVSGTVLPTSAYFPDHFDRTPQAVARLLRRVVKLAGLTDLNIGLHIVTPEQDALGGGGGCSSGACGVGGGAAQQVSRLTETDDGWVVNVGHGEVGNPIVLTTGLIRAVSAIFMKEMDLHRFFVGREAEGGVDLTGVLLGFGGILANGAHVYQKG